ncbi:MAG TPA: elongation factor P [Acidobacteriota bacterium]|nr:elongation factor P [Acidobacteriota bacterium]
MINATQIRKGNVLLVNGEPHRVMDFHHRTPGKGQAIVRALLRNLKTGASYEQRFNSNETVERVILEQKEMQYLYNDGTHYHFMNTETYEQFPIDVEMLGDAKDYLKEEQVIEVEFYDDSPIGVSLPKVVELEVTETEPELKGATASNSPKPATLETGVVVQVPPFVKVGDVIRVDPSEGRYIERA